MNDSVMERRREGVLSTERGEGGRKFLRYALSGFAAVALLLALAACDQGLPRTVNIYLDSQGTWHLLPQAAASGPMLVELRPESVAGERSYRRITIERMNQVAAQRTRTIFTIDPERAVGDVRVIYLFGALEGFSGRTLCRDGGQVETGRKGAETKIIAVLCREQSRLAETHAWVKSDMAAQDDAYVRVVTDITNGLFRRPETQR